MEDDDTLCKRLLLGFVAIAALAGMCLAGLLWAFGAPLPWRVAAGIAPLVWLVVHMLIASTGTSSKKA